MRTLNRAAADVLRTFAPSAVTDVTGFGLLGHVHEMATRSDVRIDLAAASLPALDGALESARAGVSTAGTCANRANADVEVEERGAGAHRAGVRPADCGRVAGSRWRATETPRSRPSSHAQDSFWHGSGSVAAGAGITLR